MVLNQIVNLFCRSQGLCSVLATLQLQVANTEASKLNPLAKEFVPSTATSSTH